MTEASFVSMGLKEAAKFLRMHKDTLAARARDRLIPGVKNGRAWCFLQGDLIAYMRAQYKPALAAPCLISTSKKALTLGTSGSKSPGSHSYVDRLEQMIAARRKRSATS